MKNIACRATEVDYDYGLNLHTIAGPRAILERLFQGSPPKSLLDLGCGTGTWLRAALDLGVTEIYGVDGIPIEQESLLFPRQLFRVEDLSWPLNLGRRFDFALCM